MAPSFSLPADQDLPPEIREALTRLPPLNIFRMLATLPASFRPFLELGGSLLGDPEFSAATREIAILRVAHVTNAPYEWAQHAQLARNVGVTEREVEAARSDDPGAVLDSDGTLVCRVADEISRDVRLSDEALQQLHSRYGARGAATLILCVSYYNMVSRFLESTRVEIESADLLTTETPDAIIEREGSTGR